MTDRSTQSNGGDKRAAVMATSEHEPSFRLGLWEEVGRNWPPSGFRALRLEQLDSHVRSLEAATNGVLMPQRPEQQSAGEMMFYELRVLREHMLQGSLFYAVRTSIDAELLGFETTPNMRRGQWVQYCLYVLHVALRDGREHAPETKGAQAHLLDGIVRRLAHELPEPSGFPNDVLPTLARVYTDWQQADEAYGRVPSRWIDEQTVAAPWLLGRSCGEYLTNGDAVGARELARKVALQATALVEALDLPGFWKRLAQMLAASRQG